MFIDSKVTPFSGGRGSCRAVWLAIIAGTTARREPRPPEIRHSFLKISSAGRFPRYATLQAASIALRHKRFRELLQVKQPPRERGHVRARNPRRRLVLQRHAQ